MTALSEVNSRPFALRKGAFSLGLSGFLRSDSVLAARGSIQLAIERFISTVVRVRLGTYRPSAVFGCYPVKTSDEASEPTESS